jgi:hypothetical protein
MPLILTLNNSGSERRASPKIKYKEKVIMKNTKETLMEKTKAELNIELALLGIELTASKLKNTNKSIMVKMIMDDEQAYDRIGEIYEAEMTDEELEAHENGPNEDETSENAETQKSVDQLNTELEKRIGEDDETAQMFMNIKTGTVDSRKHWFYENEDGEQVNAVDKGEVVPVFWGKETETWSEKKASEEEAEDQKEPTSIDEMFESTMHKKLKDLKLDDAKGLSDVKKAKMKDKPNYDLLYNQFRNTLVEQGLNLFVGRNNRDGEMRALTHVKDMQWGVMITKTGFRFELFLQDRTYKMEENTNGIPELNKKINNLFGALKPNAQKTLSTQIPTGRSTRYKICISHEGFDAVEHAKAFSVFHKYLMVGINELYPQETEKKSKTA